MTKIKKKTLPKLFVLDTNVILHDSRCIHSFEENDIAIPITVLEELDNFKRGNELINFQAREFLRQIDELTGDILFEDGVPLGAGLGRLRIIVGQENYPAFQEIFFEDTPDNRILSALYSISQKEPEHQTILVSKDTNLRMKAKSLGLPAQDYTTDKIESIDKIYTGMRLVEGIPTEVIDTLYQAPYKVEVSQLPDINNKIANENFILRNRQKSALATYLETENVFYRVDKKPAYGIMPRNAEQTFALKALTDDRIPLVSMSGKAGTGKTLLALAGALASCKNYRQIFLARPIVPLSNRDLGFLPGDIKSKIDPYMQPLFDNLSVIRHQFKESDSAAKKITEMMDKEKLVITPLAFIRGRSFQKVYFIVDEAQNLTPHEVKTIITRAGEGTKFVFTGDIYQIDHPYLDTLSNGLSYLINRMKGQPSYAHITLEKGERSPLAELASNLL
ncbi:MAG: PhoH family protein [Candidatus Marinimicrobia bacterium]|nr:PhoH family protein [Candidatus Neomarinimicrobiota bacterium]